MHNERVMWCAVQVRPGHERAMAHRMERVAGAAVQQTMVLRRELPFRRDGIWTVRTDVLFPGYVIVATCDAEDLASKLDLITEFHHLLRQGDAVATLDEGEVALIHALGGTSHTVSVSLGEIVQGRLRVTAGPLMGREDLVTKIDRHKRLAYLDAPAFPRIAGGTGLAPDSPRRAPRVGLEVMAKS